MAGVLIIAAASAVLMVIHLFRVETVTAVGNPLIPIFASRLMIAAARLTLLFAGVFVVLSILVHMRRGQWLTAVGPFKVSEAARRLAARYEETRKKLRAANARNRELAGTVDDLHTTVKTLRNQVRRLEDLLERGRPGG